MGQKQSSSPLNEEDFLTGFFYPNCNFAFALRIFIARLCVFKLKYKLLRSKLKLNKSDAERLPNHPVLPSVEIHLRT